MLLCIVVVVVLVVVVVVVVPNFGPLKADAVKDLTKYIAKPNQPWVPEAVLETVGVSVCAWSHARVHRLVEQLVARGDFERSEDYLRLTTRDTDRLVAAQVLAAFV